MSFPEEVQTLVDALNDIPGLIALNIENGFHTSDDLDGYAEVYYPQYLADLPLAALRRTDGTASDEVLVQFMFDVERSERGFKGLEFLSAFVREQARGDENMQIRTMGMPPSINVLGTTLKFYWDWFVNVDPNNFQTLLDQMKQMGKDLKNEYEMLKDSF